MINPHTKFHKKTEVFRRWCIIACRIINKITTFWNLDLLSSSGKRRETLAVGPPGFASLTPAQIGDPFYLKTEEDPASETL
jgi:hypothetical protein